MDITRICNELRKNSAILSQHTAAQKNNALAAVARSLDKNRNAIIQANGLDLDTAQKKGMSDALLERLMLDSKRIDSAIEGIQTVISQADPVGEVLSGWNTGKGLSIKQIRVPLGVVAIIYESRPNVTVDAFCLAYKSGNAILLRGSSAALNSNRALMQTITEGLSQTGSDGVPGTVTLSDSTDHSDVDQILTAVGLIDCVLPRGGANLIRTVVEKARIPVIETGSGVCHLFIDEDADIQMAAAIAENAKIQRPGACNAIECILVHKNLPAHFYTELVQKFAGRVQLRADEYCFDLLKQETARYTSERWGSNILIHASPEDYGTEFLDLVCTIHAVNSTEEAISYINTHNTRHSESIITNNRMHARQFQQQVDAACVYVNASTRFTDGGEFGFGAELGISTQKLHARGPMGITALTTTKFLIDGDGQIR
jgi:glutamate-5-semialdehyde dehydrogenase